MMQNSLLYKQPDLERSCLPEVVLPSSFVPVATCEEGLPIFGEVSVEFLVLSDSSYHILALSSFLLLVAFV